MGSTVRLGDANRRPGEGGYVGPSSGVVIPYSGPEAEIMAEDGIRVSR